jgi:hypothetical protein
MAANPTFAVTPKIGQVRIATANTNRDGTGTLGTVYTGVAAGSRVLWIQAMATSSTTAGAIRLFVDNGSTVYLWREVLVTALTPSVTVLGWNTSWFSPVPGEPLLVLPSTSYVLKAGTHIAESFDIIACVLDL